MKYIDAERLKAEIERLQQEVRNKWTENPRSSIDDGFLTACSRFLDITDSLQQEQPETDMKSPFTGGKVEILSREEELTFRGEIIKVARKYYRCEDTGREFTNDKLDEDMMWAAFRAYCEKKGMTSFTDIMLKQEQPEVDLEKELKDFLNKPDFWDALNSGEKGAEYLARHFFELGLNARKKE